MQVNKNRIAMLMPYFGKWPVWFNLFLLGCKRNSFIDFHFFTDCPIPTDTSENIIFHKISWTDYQALISERLGINYKRENGYALCDVRPFYGLIHRELLEGYEFWGYGDVDICYGNLSLIANDRTLKRYDVISTHADRISGHFVLIRNNDHYRTLCLKTPKWKEKLESQEMYGVDEHDFTALVFPQIKNIHRLYRYLWQPLKKDYRKGYSILMWPWNKMTRHLLKEMWTSPAPKLEEKWIYDLTSGKVYAPGNKEIPYLHFLFFKKTPFYKTENYWKDDFWQIDNNDLGDSTAKIVFDTKGIHKQAE